MTKTGRVQAMKLLHRNGSIRCNPNYRATYWGCSNLSIYPTNNNLSLTIITNANKEAHLPPAEELHGKHSYSLEGIGQKSPELIFSNPLHCLRNHELQLWYDQDWSNIRERENIGTSYVDVYAWYIYM